jgi:hypothetical protein
MSAAITATLDAPPPRAALQSRAADFSVDRGVSQYLEVIERLMQPRQGTGHAALI